MDINYIKENLNMNIYHYDCVASTNDMYKEINNELDYLIISDRQTNGRGTNKRIFLSQRGGIYMSYVINNNIDNITFKVGASIFNALNNNNIKLKWINDVYYNNKKLCGILVERVEDKYIIGIGINYEKLDSFSYVKEFSNVSKEDLIISIINNINSDFDFMSIYRNNCLTINSKVLYKGSVHKVIDINNDGSLKLDNDMNIHNRYDIEFL